MKKSEFKRAFDEDGANKTHIGGQALLEGIMMRGKYNWAVAVRKPDGEIYTEEHELASGKDKHKWMRLPFIRGCVALVESLALGFKALEIASEHAFADEESEGGDEAGDASEVADAGEGSGESEAGAAGEGGVEGVGEVAPASSEEKSDKIMLVSMVLGIILGVALFIVAPAAITNLIVGEYDGNPIIWNIVDGVLRVAVFIAYIWLIGRMSDIRRMFMYHGAEHKTIHCFEHNLPLTPENAKQFPRLHVRCGTAFLIMVLIIAIIVYTVIPVNAAITAWGVPDGLPKLLLVIAVRIIFLPVIAGISYEITVKWAGSHPENPVVKVVLWPGMQMQRLTTNEPEREQLECAIAAMELVVARELPESVPASFPRTNP